MYHAYVQDPFCGHVQGTFHWQFVPHVAEVAIYVGRSLVSLEIDFGGQKLDKVKFGLDRDYPVSDFSSEHCPAMRSQMPKL